MKSTLEHLPEDKQRELARVVEIIHEEFSDALEGSSTAFKKRGRILKIILFGSYARDTFVDDPHTMKGYTSDFDILVLVSNRKLAEPQYWNRASDRLKWDKAISPLVGLIVHGAREVNNYLAEGRFFFVDILREGIVLYELDERPLAEPKALGPGDALKMAREHFDRQHSSAQRFLELSRVAISRNWDIHAAFLLHQAVEAAYPALLLTLTNHSPPSHNLTFLRGLAEDRDRRLVEAWPREQHLHTVWFKVLNEAYVKARYSHHFEISEEALCWLMERANVLLRLVESICRQRLAILERAAGRAD
ncbi:nucleotidyltransferase and HEPN domain-containing protein (plasmid) [Sinorhizobium garamanticum]|uniref:Nucleotidyltransferase and HEPN domain-containing protein n=1 Tax=Sinorhizobium garamanticum TaxID=680247 RepID=A0ABY8DR00_9HYPH|nr:nucleotidyltransferase and HEPN domain-containing protein [Sinorhizobium garamanticum]WEX91391.1 nucleotidyltransferase and HEPN domain-containing protein [Sinorhizobium garamanticum]